MDLGSLRALALDLNFSAHGVPVTVTLPLEGAIATRGIWLVPLTEGVPGSADFQRREPKRVMALRRDEVSSVPRGTPIIAPELAGGRNRAWKVDEIDRVEADHVRVLVILDPDGDCLLPAE